MQFFEKLDFLMNITKTTNSALAHSILLDASYISRLRSGKRLLPKNDDIIRRMGDYLARNCTESYQQKAITDAFKSDNIAFIDKNLPQAITRWLLHKNEGGSEKAGIFLENLSELTSKPITIKFPETDKLIFPNDDISVYYGIQGKRQAVLYFLSEIASREKPQTLLLFSDEETSWMTSDPAFSKKFEILMIRVLAKGNKIKIIHTTSRDLDEMLNAISQWMPLYMTGSIEPFFYPKKRDGIFKRTLFIAPDTAAIVSNSVGNMTGHAANILVRTPDAIASFTEEFMQYLHMCKPLMRILTGRDKEAYFAILSEFEQESADTIIKTESLSLLTMPEDLLTQIFQRSQINDNSFINIHKSRNRSLYQALQTNRFTEIISIPDAEAVRNGEVKVVMSEMLFDKTVYYTQDEYIRHLTHIIELLKNYESFHVQIPKRDTEYRYTVYAREELGVIVTKTSLPPVVLAFNESNMVAAFWDFLKDIIGDKHYENPDNEAAIQYLQSYIHNLDNEI